MPGYVNSYYKDGVIPSNTKPGFRRFNILTAQGVIAKNALTFMHKIINFPQLMPKSIRETIPSDAPLHGSDHISCQNWLDKFDTICYHNSIFYKGPLIYIDPVCTQLTKTTNSVIYMNAFKNNVKRMLLDIQNKGESDQWQANNFLLFTIAGLRKSERVNIT